MSGHRTLGHVCVFMQSDLLFGASAGAWVRPDCRRGCTVAVAVTVREVDAAHIAVPVDALVSGETATCLFRSAGSLGPPVQN